MNEGDQHPLLGADWPIFGWAEDIRPSLRGFLEHGSNLALATLYQVEGSAPRAAGAQMLFDGARAAGYFSGGCVEADVARHAAEVIANGEPRRLHYGEGSPWRDIKLRCGGAIHIFVERLAAAPARELLHYCDARRPALWLSDGRVARVAAAAGEPLLSVTPAPFTIARRFDPRWRLIVSGWEPTALAIAQLGAEAGFETILVRADGPSIGPALPGVCYRRAALGGVDAWTAFVAATHDSELDIPACAMALSAGAGYVGLLGAFSRVAERTEAIVAAGAPREALARLHAPAGDVGLGKAPWRIAVGVIAQILRVTNERET